MAFYERQPYIQPLHSTILEVMAGDIHVPLFQRPGTEITWGPEQRQALLDSVYRGYPIGTILLWTTTMALNAHERVGGFRIPQPIAGKAIRFLLDGHQRLSSLVQIFGKGLQPDLPNQVQGSQELDPAEEWVFDMEPLEATNWFGSSDATKLSEKRNDQFVLLRVGQTPTRLQLPLSIVFNRSALNRWVRESELDEAQTREVDQLRDRFREYSMLVAFLRVDTLGEATESIKRINSSGTPLGDFNMVAALAYGEEFDLHRLFEQLYNEFLEPIGWRQISRSDILRVCAGILQGDPTRLIVDDLAKKFKQDQTLLNRVFKGVVEAVAFFKAIGIHGPEMLPYSWQLIVIAIVLHEEGHFDENMQKRIERWFWLTTYGAVFVGGRKSTVYRKSKDALTKMLLEQSGEQEMERYVSSNVYLIQDERFDFRAARAKACLLAMARLQDSGDCNGPAHCALARGLESLQLLPHRGGVRSNWWQLVIVGQDQSLNQFRDALSHRVDKPEIFDAEADDLLQKIGIPRDARGTEEALLQARRDFILTKEKEFVTELGLTWKDQNS